MKKIPSRWCNVNSGENKGECYLSIDFNVLLILLKTAIHLRETTYEITRNSEIG